jgi:HEAT repeat protein
MRDTESVALLAEVLSGRKEPIEVRGQVAEALGYIGDPRAFAALAKAALDQSAEIRFWSVFALGTLGDERARPILERLERDDLAIVEGWGTVADEAALALEELTKRDDYD